jgi:hypothetical protein
MLLKYILAKPELGKQNQNLEDNIRRKYFITVPSSERILRFPAVHNQLVISFVCRLVNRFSERWCVT